MRILILLACVVVGCLSFPDMSKRRLSTHGTSETIADTVRIMHYIGMKKRQAIKDVDPIQLAFDMTDSNDDGHVTENEFASYCVNNIPSLHMSYNIWVEAFRKAMHTVDANGNGTLEVDEYGTLARMGGYMGK